MPARTRRRKPSPAAAAAKIKGAAGTRKEHVLDPIITMNASGIIQSASDSVEQVFGWKPTELFGRSVGVLIPEPRRSELDQYLDRYRHSDRTKTLTKRRRFEAVRKDGTAVEIELSMSRADLPQHNTPFFIGIIRDISHQIDTGADTTDLRSRLQQLVTEQTRALASANLRLHLADRLTSLGTLAAGLGHDMNNVLLPVRARLDALEHGAMTPAAHAHIAAVRHSIAYLQHLSDGLHFLAVTPNSPTEAEAVLDGGGTTDLAQWWSQVGTLLRTILPKGGSLIADIPEHLPEVALAPHWLTQAMLNLIVNAGEAVKPGPRRARVRIWAEAADEGGFVRLGVTDNGRGMTPATRQRALDLFFTTKPRGMGTGLGLPLARKVAVRGGGDLEITSQPGKGTTVVLTLAAVKRVSRGSSRPLDERSAMVSIPDLRAAALISQILLTAGLTLRPPSGRGPGTSDLWVTEPTPQALAAAQTWQRRRGPRTLVLFGTPSTRTARHWKAMSPSVIDARDNFESMRQTLGHALIGPPSE